MNIQPYYIVPLLIEQPTWGGTYISRFKSISNSKISNEKIGQAYELAQESILTSQSGQQNYLFASATSINKTEQFGESKNILLSELISQNPLEVLGKKVIDSYGAKMPLLIKFTQALSNSYQVHVKSGKEFNHWKAKPESWYFFEKGKATLGLAKNGNPDEYKKRCIEIHAFAEQVSRAVLANNLSVEEARQKLEAFIQKDHPNRFVNTVFLESETVIDLSEGGIHHSWETDSQIPDGNIVYEVQLDVKDELCTLRSFDQGKIKDDGGIRSLTIEEYFTALDTDPVANNPDQFLQPSKKISDKNATITTLFNTRFYSLTNITFSGSYQSEETNTEKSGFHHLFVKKGNVTVITKNGNFPLATGWSLFIPANTTQYSLSSSEPAEVLKTTA